MLDFLQDKSEKKVEYIELIYDLIFVYLVSQNGQLLHNIEDGFITTGAYLTYLASSVVILQIWYFSSLLINRYGSGTLREHLGLFVNMYLLYFMADGIRVDWGPTYLRYNLAWALILINLAVQYLLRLRFGTPLSPRERHHARLQVIILRRLPGISSGLCRRTLCYSGGTALASTNFSIKSLTPDSNYVHFSESYGMSTSRLHCKNSTGQNHCQALIFQVKNRVSGICFTLCKVCTRYTV